jgi:type IV pilus assembly protein PilX
MWRSTAMGMGQQRGLALFMSLVMLLILTILGVSSVQNTSLQERMSRNALDSNLAFQAAESALRDGEDFIEDNFNSLVPFDAPGAAATGLYYDKDWDQNPNWKGRDWAAANGSKVGATNVVGVATPPKYIIEHVKTVVSDQDRLNLDNIGQDTGTGRTQIFRVTTYGTGGSATAHVMLQSTWGKKF